MSRTQSALVLVAATIAVGCPADESSLGGPKADAKSNKTGAAGAKTDPKAKSASKDVKAGDDAKAEGKEPGDESEPEVAEPKRSAAWKIPAGPRPYLFLKETGESAADVYFVDAKGGEPNKLGHVVQYLPGGTAGVGSTGPALSADAKWIAFFDAQGMVVAPVGDGKAHHIPEEGKGGRVTLLVSGFSPDSKTLLFHRDEADGMEPVPVPEGFTLGYHKLGLPDMLETRWEGIDGGFTAWLADNERVVWVQSAKGTASLVVQPGELAKTADAVKPLLVADSIGQPSFNGDSVAYVGGAHDSKVVTLSRLDGSNRVELTEPAGFAVLQWPRPSPDNKRVAFCRRRTPKRPDSDVVMVDVAKPKQVRVLFKGPTGQCEFGWLSNNAVLSLDSGNLTKVPLSGQPELVAENVAAFMLAGDPPA